MRLKPLDATKFKVNNAELEETLKALEPNKMLDFFYGERKIRDFRISLNTTAKRLGMKLKTNTYKGHFYVSILYRSEQIEDLGNIISILTKYPELEEARYLVTVALKKAKQNQNDYWNNHKKEIRKTYANENQEIIPCQLDVCM